MTILMGITWVCVLVVVIGLFYYVWDDRNKRRLHEHRRVEISELAMVFQTLRDIVSEQKMLAKEFNEQVEEKLSVVRSIVNEAQDRMKKIQQEINEQLQKVKEFEEEIDRIISQKNILQDLTINCKKSGGEISIIEAEIACEEISDRTNFLKREKDKESDENLIEDVEKENRADLIVSSDEKGKDDWKGIGEEQEKIKNAYRSLLISPAKDEVEKSEDKVQTQKDKKEPPEELTPVQKTVLEYHNAGMTIGEIAKELGLTKGEVRLILSLAISKSSKEN